MSFFELSAKIQRILETSKYFDEILIFVGVKYPYFVSSKPTRAPSALLASLLTA